MRLSRIIVLLMILFFNFFDGQENKQFFVTYMFYNRDANEVYKINLRIDKFEAFSEFINTSTTKDTITENDNDGNIELNINIKNKDSIGAQFYQKKDSIIFRDHIYINKRFTPVIVKEEKPKFDWKLLDDIETINNYLCNKASLNFRGRQYTVWYTTEIPTHFGPWKFQGLPGLIFKIESSDKNILFDLIKISKVEKEIISKPSQGNKITFLEYKNLQEKSITDIIENLRSKLPRDTEIKINNIEMKSIEKNYD